MLRKHLEDDWRERKPRQKSHLFIWISSPLDAEFSDMICRGIELQFDSVLPMRMQLLLVPFSALLSRSDALTCQGP